MGDFDKIEKIRQEINDLNLQILEVLSKRAEVVQKIGQIKTGLEIAMYDPLREAEQVADLLPYNRGPLSDEIVTRLFHEIFRASLDLITMEKHHKLLASRSHHSEDTVIRFGKEAAIGGDFPIAIIAGPCAVESEEQIDLIAKTLAKMGVKFLRGGASKPRTNPYSFQGLGADGYRLLSEAAKRHGLVCMSEVMDAEDVELATPLMDMLQIGTRNMSNFRLLKVVREAGKPVLLKRGYMATYEEFLLAAEYLAQGVNDIILCERGIRTFENWTRNTLDISAVPILKARSHLPIIVDVSHAAGRRDILLPLAKASIAAGAHGVMVEVHPAPSLALSDPNQQMDIPTFKSFYRELMK